MDPFVSNAQLQVGSYTVTIGSHQWGFTDSADYLERQLGTTPYGVMHRQKYGIKVQSREVRFVKSPELLDQLRQLAIRAVLTGALVKFTPDVADAGTFWWVVWPTDVTFTPVTENRDEVVVQLQQQSPGA